MKGFPSHLNPENKENFSRYNYERTKCYLRRDLYEHIISHDENDYFALTDFIKDRKIDMNDIQKITNELIEELVKLGWKCKLSFGQTGLFIYSTTEPPSSCWEESEALE